MPSRSLPCGFRRCRSGWLNSASCRLRTHCRHAAKPRSTAPEQSGVAEPSPSARSFSPGLAGDDGGRPASLKDRNRAGRRFIAIGRGAQGRLAAEKALRKSKAKFAALFALLSERMALIRLDDERVLNVSGGFCQYFGYGASEVVGRSTLPGELGLWVDAGRRRQWREAIERDGEVHDFEAPMRRKDGALLKALLSAKRVEVDGEPCALTVVRDVDERDRFAEREEPVAHYDPLTGLPNRRLLDDRLRQAISHNDRAGARMAVCALDLDGFGEVNDLLGRQAGDQMLIEAAKRLMAGVRSGDTVARLGGDEFAIALSGLISDDEWRSALDRLLVALSAPYAFGDRMRKGLSASVGVTLYPNDPADPDTLIRHAREAMLAAKQAGNNRCHMFDAEIEQRIEARRQTRRRLAKALESGQFRLHYQPQVDCRTGRCVGAEALIRWQHPTLGLLPPAEFLPLIESADLALEVGEWVIREALSQIVRWRREGVDLTVSVNAFARQLQQPNFPGALAVAMERCPEAGRDRLQIEIVETAALKDLDVARQMIEDCRKLGVSFSLDDFGTGYSTLAHVRHLPVAEIKIDQSFVRQMLARSEDLAIVEVVIRLGRAFGRSLVAEGVETPAHIVRLLALGCDVMQGFALARPMPPDDIPRWVREFRPDPAWGRAAVGMDERAAGTFGGERDAAAVEIRVPTL
ncbi:MAG: EAL domain-containing protein [Roseiarcus sp.]